jgi:hypothetical protein
MNLVENVYELSESFMNKAQYVTLDNNRIYEVAQVIKEDGIQEFPIPKIPKIIKGIVLELVAGSINYCYWYGRSDVRPNGANSTLMYETAMNAFYDFSEFDDNSFSQCIDRLCRMLSSSRFPLLEERINHLKQLIPHALDFCNEIGDSYFFGTGIKEERRIEYFFNKLIELFPGYASDMFLKRASLFFLQLNRRFGIMKDELLFLHVPSDYQVPKMLEHYGCIQYNNKLKTIINSNQLIPKHSLPECEIRSATILAIKKLCEITEHNVSQIDSFFFLNRHSSDNKFHLTITTDY